MDISTLSLICITNIFAQTVPFKYLLMKKKFIILTISYTSLFLYG